MHWRWWHLWVLGHAIVEVRSLTRMIAARYVQERCSCGRHWIRKA